MGIPAYFKYITDNHPEIIDNCLDNFDSYNQSKKRLFLDLNCAIHKCCRNILNQEKYQNSDEQQLEIKMFEEIIKYINYIITKVEPQLLFIAIDGVAPRAKMSQQRLRRFKSIQEKNLLSEIYKKCGYRSSNNYVCIESVDIECGTLEFWGKKSKSGYEYFNRMLYGKCCIVLKNNNGIQELTIEEYNKTSSAR